eukprot:5178272-Pleurochrysis_carterae.AAC.1
MKEFDELCRYMTEKYLSKYISSTLVNSCDSFSGFEEAHEVIEVFTKLLLAIKRYLPTARPAAVPAPAPTRAPVRRVLRSNTTMNTCDDAFLTTESPETDMEHDHEHTLAAVGASTSPSRSAEALAISRLEKNQEELQQIMKSFLSEMRHQGTQSKTFQESLLHTMRNDRTAHAPLAALDDMSRGGRGHGGEGRGADSYAAGQTRQGRREEGYDYLIDTEPIPPKDLPSEIRAAFVSANIRGDAYYKEKPCR